MSGPAHGVVDLGVLGFEEGAHLLLNRALAGLPPGAELAVVGSAPALEVHLAVWCRQEGHRWAPREGTAGPERGRVIRGRADVDRWAGAERAGGPTPAGIVRRPARHWGLAARGALVEPGGPDLAADLDDRDVVWADLAPRLYAHAASAQWDPATAVAWDSEFSLPGEIEKAVVQVMTYLVENEQAALVIPARLLARVHPHFREVLQLLAVQAADEARHIEVFTRRALLRGGELGTSSAGGRSSLASLLSEPDFSLASFLLSVLGEGSFLSLLSFLDRYAPDPVTRQVARLARQDEARHVAFGVAHLEHQAALDPGLRSRLRSAVERRHDSLRDTAGLNADVFDALVILAAGEWTPRAIAEGHRRVRRLHADMDEGRRRRLVRLGFPEDEAAELSALHTRNFM
ncbi:ferritin-like domain-containing protein [Actinomadura sp. 6K520]|uniref:ferritin-like domain-containing protein n=1 Tax=Actinomadura sp. 6K520 TaxID=2530364 RepID=UPI001048786D|nr:ferritin-like domain-containing protein [Actinomadura sp. 6K520]TDE29071.1 ferritin-like domain-containing protein [Actinomadura sp. 6K520]